MSKQDLTLRELYEMLEPLVDELGECEVLIRYDGGTTYTPLKRGILPFLKGRMHNPPEPHRVIVLEGY